MTLSSDKVVSTDPPYYDNIGYADLSDFFYVWLRRPLRSVFPDLFTTLVAPKGRRASCNPLPSRQQGEGGGVLPCWHDAGDAPLGRAGTPDFPVTIFYAFKQAENDGAEEPPALAGRPSSMQ